jgi:carboxypeptidase Taq
LSQAAWAAARKSNDFSAFAPHLERMIGYAKKRAELWGFTERPYDALIDEHEPGMDEQKLSALFASLSVGLTELAEKIADCPQPTTEFLSREFPVRMQESYCEKTMSDLGFDRLRGRLDRSAHPFTTTLGADDIRITTRYFPTNMLSGLFSVIHETGHALYELGFDAPLRGTILADGASMGIHESQSRLWENVIGRSRSFWKGRFPDLMKAFPDALAGIDAEVFYKAVNIVKPSLIRVDADEVTYSLHIILRFDLERRMLSGNLDVDDLPDAWRDGMRRLMGIEPETDDEGVLQDIHWSMGAFGYFPSYALGNLYAAQFWDSLRGDMPDIDDRIERGDYSSILSWLRDRIHRLGRSIPPEEIIESACGSQLNAAPFLRYLGAKYSDLYGI